MQSLARALCRAGNGGSSSKIMQLRSDKLNPLSPICGRELSSLSLSTIQQFTMENRILNRSIATLPQTAIHSFFKNTLSNKYIATEAQALKDSDSEGDSTIPCPDPAPRIKFKRLDKTAKQIMSILDKEEVEKVRSEREIPDIKPGCIVELKVEVPENKRRVSTVKGIVIARRNAGLNSTFRLRRLVAGVGVESVFPLYSPNIKDVKIVDRKKVRRAKLYYLRDRMNALKK